MCQASYKDILENTSVPQIDKDGKVIEVDRIVNLEEDNTTKLSDWREAKVPEVNEEEFTLDPHRFIDAFYCNRVIISGTKVLQNDNA